MALRNIPQLHISTRLFSPTTSQTCVQSSSLSVGYLRSPISSNNCNRLSETSTKACLSTNVKENAGPSTPGAPSAIRHPNAAVLPIKSNFVCELGPRDA